MKGWIAIAASFVMVTVIGLTVLLQQTSFGEAKQTEGAKLDAEALEKVLAVGEEASLTHRKSSEVKAPSFTLKGLDGKTYTVGKDQKKPVILQFWSSWCEACTVEAPTLSKLHEAYGDQMDFYGVNLSAEESKPEEIGAFVARNKWTFPILLDDNKRASYLYELHALPTTFILDADGTVLDTFHMVDPMEFQQKLEKLTEGR
jgi:Thiol-disulfide isomerase and thioredoxins